MSKPRFTCFAAIAGLAVGMLWCGTARGGVGPVYSYVFDQSIYTVTAGGTVSVQVSLQETGPTGATFVLAPGGVGVTQANVDITHPQVGSVASVQSLGDIQPNSAFSTADTAQSFFPPNFTASLLEPSATPLFGTMVAPNTYDLLLGTFKFTAGSTPGSETITAAPSFGFSTNPTQTSTGATLDVASTTATIAVAPAVTVVPEPANVVTALGGVIAVAGWLGWSRLRPRSPGSHAGR